MAAFRRQKVRPGSRDAAESADPKERLLACIDRLTRSGEACLNPADSTELKRLCRADQQLVDLAHTLLCHRLAQEHAQIRLSAFQIVDLLFRRSRRFRELTLDRFERLVGAVLIDNEAKSSPPKPVSVFRQLGDLALQAFIDWHNDFSVEHPKLVFAFRFLSQAHSARLAQVRDRLSQAAAQQLAEARRLAEKKRELLQEARQQFSDEEAELTACLATVANCLELLVPRPEDFDVNALTSDKLADAPDADLLDIGLVDEDDFETATEDERRRLHGIVSSTATATAAGGSLGQVQLRLVRPCIRQTPDNAELLEALVTRSEQLRKRLMPKLARWLALVQRCSDVEGAEAAPLRDRLTDLVAQADRLLGQVKGLRIVRPGQDTGANNESFAADDDDENASVNESSADFEVVEKKDGFETDAAAPQSPPTRRPQAASSSSSTAAVPAAQNAASNQSASSTSASSSDQVPVVPFGLDLLHWGAKDSALGSATIGYRMDDGGHSFGYRPLDGDESFEISGSRHILTMRTMVFATPDQPVRWACRHPLPDGGVCARMDRLKCPFHGRIVPRDETGKPTSQSAEADPTAETDAVAPNKKLKKKTKEKKKSPEVGGGGGGGGLVNIRALVDNPRSRLAARVASKAALRKAAEDEDARRRRKMLDKFGDQFQYQFLN